MHINNNEAVFVQKTNLGKKKLVIFNHLTLNIAIHETICESNLRATEVYKNVLFIFI